ncbi:hypothetical protein DFA_04734 [Cavenderia fasciculata]|uniref:Peptidase S9 prolyl oligopeptidase catalytic domain-containing protein n=1 Tax=Cavenderia fasciculata TaxID=261658 RepID=F4PQE1_CACFS|nr:uncharacterized protein DFA_04734 [Cavenderia fasciculata]EGG22604.1 hypothetical protein DFA_04734 [Cavenderia fasciculata]|eukprot:XP_004360455.1 hypothetical protein DFA_04734 [Cavenderia fasciculata]
MAPIRTSNKQSISSKTTSIVQSKNKDSSNQVKEEEEEEQQQQQQIYYDQFKSPIGWIGFHASNNGLTNIKLDIQVKEDDDNNDDISVKEKKKGNKITNQFKQELDEYFKGERFEFQTELDQSIGTPFQKQAWEELVKVKYGETASYKDVAIKMGRPSAPRAVATACLSSTKSIVDLNPSSLPTQYNVIGPFPIGEREEGLDTLEAYGGIFNIPIGDKSLYPSELGNGGMVGWVSLNSSTSGSLSLDWSQFIDWSFLQQVWGWNIWLWYGYAVGTFTAYQSSPYIISCTGTRTYFIRQLSNNTIQEFAGDFYGYGTGQQLLSLESGVTYQFIVRMDSSVRLNQSPLGAFTCQLQLAPQPAIVLENQNLVADIVNGQLASPYLTVTIFNTYTSVLDNLDFTAQLSDQSLQFSLGLVANATEITAQPGQKLSIPLTITVEENQQLSCPLELYLTIRSNAANIASTTITFNCTQFTSPYLFTFLDYDNTVQYAMVNPPSNCQGSPCGVMIATHGAGVESSSQFWIDAIAQQKSLWILYPTGRTSWGYDWSSSSRINVFNSHSYLVSNLPGVPTQDKESYAIDPSKIFFVGHSMGGHGCWTLLSHFGDMALGGACAAGFVKLQFYVFMNTRPGFSYVDPVLQGLLMASISDEDNDLYSTNLVGIPLMARYGQNDTNVNPWHSRRMARMTAEQSENATAVVISEIPNQGHWFNGILGDDYMQAFYNSIVGNGLNLPPIPKTITITSTNPSSAGTRANIMILQTQIPSRVGRIQISQVQEQNGLVWMLSTQNIRRFALKPDPVRANMPQFLMIDRQLFPVEYYPYHYTSPDKYGTLWNSSDDMSWLDVERSAPTYGPMRQIFEKPVTIVYGTNVTADLQQQFQWAAVHIANVWNTYGRGSPQIIADVDFTVVECSPSVNYILLGGPQENIVTTKYEFNLPVQYGPGFSVGPVVYQEPDQGIAFLAPNECNQGLLLVVSGNSPQGFIKALRAVPMRSGVVAPDYMVVGSDWGWKGAGGIVATGFWDNTWQMSTDACYFGMNTQWPSQ